MDSACKAGNASESLAKPQALNESGITEAQECPEVFVGDHFLIPRATQGLQGLAGSAATGTV